MVQQYMLFLFRKVNQILYLILGPSRSSQLAASRWGQKLIFLLTGASPRIYIGKYGIRLLLPAREATLSGFLHLGEMNPMETAVLKGILRPGDTVFDVGAYLDGWYTIVAARTVTDIGHVYSFEPSPQAYGLLIKNIRLNNLSNVTIERLAVAERNSERTFYADAEASSLFAASGKDGGFRVQTVSLDSYVQTHRIKRVNLLKIDVEGAECSVLAGAKKILSGTTCPDIIIEVVERYLRKAGQTEQQLLLQLFSFGYAGYAFTPTGLIPYMKPDQGRQVLNLFFSKKPRKLLPLRGSAISAVTSAR